MLIEGELMDIGVEAICNYNGGYVDVAFDEKKNEEAQIRSVIKKLGYTVQ